MQQPSQSEFDRISPTALMVAYARAFADIPYSKDLSRLVNAQSVVENLLGQKLEQVAEIAILIESRYRAINQLIANHRTNSPEKPCQIIEIASGLLPRGMDMSKDPDVTFIESDLPLMINQKASLVKALVGDRPNLHFVPIDVTSNQLADCRQYLNPDESLTVLSEGLLMYLSHNQKQQVFKNIQELLQIYGGVWVTPDFVTVEAINRRKQISPNLEKISQMVSRLSDRPIEDTYFQNSEEIEDFIASQGFKCDRTPVLELIHQQLEQLTCLKPLNLDPQTAEAILADSFVYSLSLETLIN
jgi:O-methyltransferase involved in polyketide biosynthesis